MAMPQSGNWTIETSNTIGIGAITLSGAIDLQHTRFQQTLLPGEVYYTILDGTNREAGLGTFNGTTGLIRTTVINTLVNGVYNDITPDPIDLSGSQVVANTFNASSYRELFNHLTEIGNPHNVKAYEVPYDPTLDPTSTETDVQSALVDHGLSIEQRVSSLSGIIEGGFITGTGTQFSVTGGSGEIVDSYTTPNNTSIIEVTWASQSNIVLQTNQTSGSTRIFINNSGLVQQFTDLLTPDILREYILLGLVFYQNGSIIEVVNSPSIVKQTATDLYDVLQQTIVVDGLNVLPVINQLQTYVGEGSIFYPGANWYTDRKIPNNLLLAQDGNETTPITFTPITQDGSEFTPLQDYPIAWNPSGNTLTNLTGNDATIHRLYRLGVESPVYYMLYGQNLYTNTERAKENLFVDDNNTVYPDILSDMRLIAHIGINDNAQDFDDIGDAWIVSTTTNTTTTSSSAGSSHTTLTERDALDQHPIESIGTNAGEQLRTTLDSKAPLTSPNLTGTPTTPTASIGTDTTQIASTAFVLANGGGGGVHMGDTPPVDKVATPIWFNTDTGKTLTWYTDDDSSQWVQDVATGEGVILGDDSVNTNNIVNFAVTNAKIADQAVNAAKITSSSITNTQIANTTITGSKLANSTITGTQIANTTITGSKLVTGTITGTQLASNSVSAIKILSGNVTADKLGSNSVTTIKILNGNVTADKLATDSVTTIKILNGNITGAKIANKAVTATQIADNTITGTQLAASSVSQNQLADNSVISSKLADQTTMPTVSGSPIVENGSIGYTSWIKYADGTMIITSNDTSATITDVVMGSIFRSTAVPYTYPIPFVNTPVVTTSATSSSGSFWTGARSVSSQLVEIRLFSGLSTTTAGLKYIAIGRWK